MSAVSFEESLRETGTLIIEIENREVDNATAEAKIGRMLSSVAGARGFLVSLLTSDSGGSDKTPDVVLKVFKEYPDSVCDLLVRNLVMSTTMAISHERNADVENRLGSVRVQQRTFNIIAALKISEMNLRLDEMWSALTKNEGPYVDFLKRWQYDTEQLNAASEIIAPLRAG